MRKVGYYCEICAKIWTMDEVKKISTDRWKEWMITKRGYKPEEVDKILAEEEKNSSNKRT